MTVRTWIAIVVVAAALVSAWLAADWRDTQAALRSPHARPADAASGRVVVVTAAGKLFHREGCAFVHGPALRERDGEAIAAGYTPCPRCLPR